MWVEASLAPTTENMEISVIKDIIKRWTKELAEAEEGLATLEENF
mgnify:CR=1 FL=1